MFRSFKALAVAATLALTPIAAPALTPDEAEALAQDVISEAINLAESDVPLAEKIDAFEGMMQSYADLNAIGRYALGVAWRSASQPQQQAYLDAFTDYLARKYGQQFRRFDGQTVNVIDAFDAGQRGIVVRSEVIDANEPEPIRVEWQFSDRSGQARLIDIIVEGISLLSTERQEIGARLDAVGGDIDRLIADLRRAENS
ncbi:MAG: MlaC/ttg2D family ABC transporter substrate-binding protein [Rubricella sp.]